MFKKFPIIYRLWLTNKYKIEAAVFLLGVLFLIVLGMSITNNT
ncbi:MAG: hypothetical protein JWQ66_3382 [Mucilaginibacter sp.]|nr:hypothetical protein [Mucilaginibacter sp.]